MRPPDVRLCEMHSRIKATWIRQMFVLETVQTYVIEAEERTVKYPRKINGK